ncbi:unnamed protein product, partial [marine sediment metagenome]
MGCNKKLCGYSSILGGYSIDKCVDGIASADNSIDAGRNHDKAFDDNLLTTWVSAQEYNWLKYDFGVGVAHKFVRMTYIQSFDQDYCIQDYRIQGSNNNSDWDTLVDDRFINTHDKQIIDFANTIAYRYFRLFTDTSWQSGGAGTTISALEVEVMIRIPVEGKIRRIMLQLTPDVKNGGIAKTNMFNLAHNL